MLRTSFYFDSLSTVQLRIVLAAFSVAFNSTQDAPLRGDARGVIVGCDGPEKFNARVPLIKGNALALFLNELNAKRLFPDFDPAVLSDPTVIAYR